MGKARKEASAFLQAVQDNDGKAAFAAVHPSFEMTAAEREKQALNMKWHSDPKRVSGWRIHSEYPAGEVNVFDVRGRFRTCG
jgi:hypothetical protein